MANILTAAFETGAEFESNLNARASPADDVCRFSRDDAADSEHAATHSRILRIHVHEFFTSSTNGLFPF